MLGIGAELGVAPNTYEGAGTMSPAFFSLSTCWKVVQSILEAPEVLGRATWQVRHDLAITASLLLPKILEHPPQIVSELPGMALPDAMQLVHDRVIPHG